MLSNNILRYGVKTLKKPSVISVIIKRNIFINTETTPNPHSMKFLPQTEVLPEKFGTGMYYEKNQLNEIMKSPLAKQLFAIDGIKSVFFGKDFVSITKNTDEVWMTIKPQVFSALLDFYASEKSIIEEHNNELSDTAILDTDDEIIATIKELMETRVRPAVQEDGGDIFYVGFDRITGLVKLRLAGSCVGCPSSSVTLRNGVEKMLMHYIPEVKGIEEVAGEGSDDGDVNNNEDSSRKLSHPKQE